MNFPNIQNISIEVKEKFFSPTFQVTDFKVCGLVSYEKLAVLSNSEIGGFVCYLTSCSKNKKSGLIIDNYQLKNH